MNQETSKFLVQYFTQFLKVYRITLVQASRLWNTWMYHYNKYTFLALQLKVDIGIKPNIFFFTVAFKTDIDLTNFNVIYCFIGAQLFIFSWPKTENQFIAIYFQTKVNWSSLICTSMQFLIVRENLPLSMKWGREVLTACMY